jgi:hypothetical protein
MLVVARLFKREYLVSRMSDAQHVFIVCTV